MRSLFDVAALILLTSTGFAQVFLHTRLPESLSVDIAIYGATGAGCIAAIAAKRSGAGEVLLLSQTGHVGGMLTGGLQHTDSANDTVIQGITREFFIRTESEYPGRPTDANYPPGHSPPGWLFESHVGERVLLEMLTEANVTVIRNVVNVAGVVKEGSVVRSITLEGTDIVGITAKGWIDASYEGDLLDRAGASMTWGRESSAQYGEQSAGRQSYQSIGATVNPYWDAAEDPPRVLPHVKAEIPVKVGGEDRWMQPYDFRLCLTNSPGNRLAITKPDSYNASEWELWRRIYKVKPPKNLGQAGLGCLGPVPNTYSDCGSKACKKCDMLGMNHGTDMTNGADGYPNGTTAERRAIWQAHVEFTRGLLWFWMTDDAVPASVRAEVAELGHCTDEYDADSDPPYWPHQLYVREAKRLVGDWVWTQFKPAAALLNRSIGLGSYSFDSHVVSRVIDRSASDPSKHIVVKEGRVDVHSEQTTGTMPSLETSEFMDSTLGSVTMPPYQMPYDILLPRRSELTNVLSAVAISASHVRFNAIRMEPTWMIMGQAAGDAAVMAVSKGIMVQDVDVAALQEVLLDQKQKLVP